MSSKRLIRYVNEAFRTIASEDIEKPQIYKKWQPFLKYDFLGL